MAVTIPISSLVTQPAANTGPLTNAQIQGMTLGASDAGLTIWNTDIGNRTMWNGSAWKELTDSNVDDIQDLATLFDNALI